MLPAGSLFPILPTWLSLRWHPPCGRCHGDPSAHRVFSGAPFRKRRPNRSMMHFSPCLITCPGNLHLCLQLSWLCPVTVSLARKLISLTLDTAHSCLARLPSPCCSGSLQASPSWPDFSRMLRFKCGSCNEQCAWKLACPAFLVPCGFPTIPLSISFQPPRGCFPGPKCLRHLDTAVPPHPQESGTGNI